MRINYFNSIWRGSHIAEDPINGLAQVPRFPTKSEALISYPCSRNASITVVGVEPRTGFRHSSTAKLRGYLRSDLCFFKCYHIF